jgi:predicted RNase H-like HicB family nuclease
MQNNQHEELQALVKAGYRVLQEEVCMTRQFDVVVEQDSEGFFVATVPSLPGCHTQAKSLDELMVRVREAIELCIKDVSPTDEIMDFVGVQRITVNA